MAVRLTQASRYLIALAPEPKGRRCHSPVFGFESATKMIAKGAVLETGRRFRFRFRFRNTMVGSVPQTDRNLVQNGLIELRGREIDLFFELARHKLGKPSCRQTCLINLLKSNKQHEIYKAT